MSVTYPAIYKDQFRSESVTILDDGRAVKLSLRGVEFSGGYFSLTPPSNQSSALAETFHLFEGELCDYSLEFDLPIIVVNNGKELETTARVHLECGKPVESTGWTVSRKYKDGRIEQEKERIDSHSVSLKIEIDQKIYRVSNLYSDFETPLIELSKQFPPEVYLKVCLNCRLSEYPPNIVNSGLRCFKNAKSEFKQVKEDKWAFIELYTEKGIVIDETYVCSEFEKRPPFVWR